MVFAKTYGGDVLASSSAGAIPGALATAARHRDRFVMAGHIDPYDDTVFNRVQLGVLVEEFEQLGELCDAEQVEALRELIGLARVAMGKVHATLLFSGD
ncbi:hypothetical protein BJP25_26615 [Actinokineospora bangkokensis]|uniref:Four helix bundle protein n=2 Tax=Actinokineospora bangkokensis TaxID=1193682 RepID=A0A1Q9LGS5_9PSEU|nr:hypothetical protein BJP25_26615 [Actinokineospora bangkokensis]